MGTYKVVIVGESMVGKTSLIKAFIGKDIKNVERTIGVDFYSFKINESSVIVWDFAGQEWYREIIVNFLKGASLVVMVFDLSRVETLNALINNWAEYVEKLSGKETIVIVVGNKSDIKTIDDETIAHALDKLKERLNVKLYMQTSALKNEGVSRLFQSIFDYVRMIDKISKIKREKN